MNRAFWRVSRRQSRTSALSIQSNACQRTCVAVAQTWPLKAAFSKQGRILSTRSHGICDSSKTHGCVQHNSNCLRATRWSSSKAQPKDSTGNQAGTTGPSVSTSSKRALSRNIVITGGTSGIGYHVARRAILEGASHVRIITRDTGRGQKTIDQLREDTGTEARLDFVEAEAVEYADSKLFDSADIDTVIHCAGITQTSLLASTLPSDIHRILQVNLESAALLAKSFLKRHMRASRTPPPTSRGSPDSSSEAKSTSAATPPTAPPSWHFVSISSLLALKSGAGSSVYAASKAGLIALTRSIALEAAKTTAAAARHNHYPAPHLRANVVVPGYIETPMTKGFSETSRETLHAEIPAGRFGTPAEVADAVLFLCANEYANNCVLNLDGGLSAT